LAALSLREKSKADALKSFSEEELSNFLDSLPVKPPPALTNSPPGLSPTKRK